jgi:hypothetical protein
MDYTCDHSQLEAAAALLVLGRERPGHGCEKKQRGNSARVIYRTRAWARTAPEKTEKRENGRRGTHGTHISSQDLWFRSAVRPDPSQTRFRLNKTAQRPVHVVKMARMRTAIILDVFHVPALAGVRTDTNHRCYCCLAPSSTEHRPKSGSRNPRRHRQLGGSSSSRDQMVWSALFTSSTFNLIARSVRRAPTKSGLSRPQEHEASLCVPAAVRCCKQVDSSGAHWLTFCLRCSLANFLVLTHSPLSLVSQARFARHFDF